MDSHDGQPLCALGDIEDGASAGFTAETGEGRKSLIAVRAGAGVHVYVNSCPHIGAPLDLRPGQFLSRDGEHILCANHGALFEIASGHCISGPCAGKWLKRVAVRIRGGMVYLGH